jgi:hypothetical protein
MQRKIFGESVGGRPRRLPRHGPRRGVIEPAVIDLAHALDEIAVLFEMLAERDDIREGGPKMRFQIPNLRRVGSGAGHETGARGRAHGLLAVGAVERHAGFGDPIDIRALDIAVSISAELGTQIVDGNKEDVRPVSGANGANQCENREGEMRDPAKKNVHRGAGPRKPP